MILNFTLNLGTKKKIKTKHVFIDINCMEKIETTECIDGIEVTLSITPDYRNFEFREILAGYKIELSSKIPNGIYKTKDYITQVTYHYNKYIVNEHIRTCLLPQHISNVKKENELWKIQKY